MFTIPMAIVAHCVSQLGQNGTFTLCPGVTVQMNGATLTIFEWGNPVFKMSVVVTGTHLEVDRAETPIDHRGRGWGRLGLLLALRYGLAQGATLVSAGTMIESGAWGFWGGIQKGTGTPIAPEVNRHITWFMQHTPQPAAGSPTMTIRAPRPGVQVIKRSSSTGNLGKKKFDFV